MPTPSPVAAQPAAGVASADAGQTLGTYLLLSGLAVSLLLPILHVLVSDRATSAETADSSVYLGLLVLTAVAMLYGVFLHGRASSRIADPLSSRWGRVLAGLVLLGILVAATATVTVLWEVRHRFWFGYGALIAALALLLLPLPLALLSTGNRDVHRLLAVATYVGLAVFYLPSIVQPPWGLIDSWHSMFVLNETLSPQSGGYPLVNFNAQYTSLLGYVYNLLVAGTLNQAIWFVTLLAVAVAVAAIVPLWRAYPAGKRYLALLFTIPAIFIVKAQEDAYSGSIAVLLSAIPVRLLFATIIAALLVTAGVRDARPWSTAALAFVCAIALLNNLESGVASTIATAMVLTVVGRRGLRLFQPALFAALVIVFLLADALVVGAAYGRPDIDALTAFVSGFGTGFGALPMPSFGLWVFVFAFLSIGAIVSTLEFGLRHRGLINDDDERRRFATLALFWSLFGLGMAPYYINRSVVSGQLQFLLLPTFVSAAALLPLLFSRSPNWRDIALFIAALPCAVSIASTIDHPSLRLALQRLRPVHPTMDQRYESAIAAIKAKIEAIRVRAPDANVGVFTTFGFVYANTLRTRSYLPVNHQDDLTVVNPAVGKKVCGLLAADNIRFLVSDMVPREEALQILRNCGFVATDEFGTEPARVAVFARQ